MRPIKEFLPYIFITIAVGAFFARLFFPPSIFTTPDFGRSDAINASLPLKYLLKENLTKLKVPLWENDIGQGYPIFAEGITGYFYLPNLVISLFLPFKLTIPAIYLFSFLTSAFSMFFLCRKLKINAYASTMAAVTYPFCASMVLHLQHFNFVQSASLLPLLFLSLITFLEKRSLAKGIVCSLILSQIMLAGFVQIFAYAMIVFFISLIIYAYVKHKTLLKPIFLSYIAICVFSLILSAVQIAPSFELIKLSTRSSGVQTESLLNNFPLFPRNYLTYLNPFILGKASNGTYNSPDWSKHGIYWENTAYIGLLPLLFYFVGVFFLFKKPQKNIFLPIFATSIICILLSLGKFSPLHILFSFPPLNFFRVPARFILFVQFFATITAAYGLDKVQDKFPKRIRAPILYSLIIATVANLYFYWWNYNPVGETEKWLTPPEITRHISREDGARVFSLSSPNWNEVFTKKGWVNQQDNYFFFRNSLDQNINVLYGISQFSMFETLPTRRYRLEQSIIKSGTTVEKNRIKIDLRAKNVLRSSAVKYVTSPLEIDSESFTKIDQVEKGDFKIYLYQITKPRSIVNLYFDYKSVGTIGEYSDNIANVDVEKSLILENVGNLNIEKGAGSITDLAIKDGHYSANVKTDKDTLFVLSSSYYPGWKAKIDGSETKIYPANINSQAILVPQGQHTVEFKYQPKTFVLGLVVSAVSYLLASLYLLRKRLKFFNRFINFAFSFF